MSDFKEEMDTLANSATTTSCAADAMHLTQAVLNLANAAQTQVFTEINEKEIK